jgi:methyl-accepting chemotaxis protein
MKVINNIKIGTKIFSTVSIIIVLMVIVAVFGIMKIVNVGGEIKEITQEDLPMLKVVTEIANAQKEQGTWFERVLRFGGVTAEQDVAKEGLQKAEQEFKSLAAFVDEQLTTGEQIANEVLKKTLTPEVRKEYQDILDLLKGIAKEHGDVDAQGLQAFDMIGQGNAHNTETLAEQIEKQADEVDLKLDEFVKKMDTFTEDSSRTADQIQQEAVQGMTIIGISALIIGVFMGAVITRSINRPLAEIVKVANNIAIGDLDQDIAISQKDEIGVLAEAMRNMVSNLKATVRVAEQIAQGDLTASVNILSEKDTLGQSLATMVAKLNEMVGDVQNVANNVATGSQALSSSSEEMSQGTTEQASSIEEVSSSIEQMAANIRQNADNAIQTEKIAVKAAEGAREGGKAVAQTVTSMQTIAKKISIVEEIARQTHMLSLNATIEAAKAQESGKGFAVVASEVRSLAERSRTAAEEINELASSSVAIAEAAGTMLTRLVPDIQKTAELVQEISAASNEQSSGTEQINKAIQQLDQVIQQNASVSEEMAATAEELAAQAEHLRDTTAFFKVQEAARKSLEREDWTTFGARRTRQKKDRKPVEKNRENDKSGTSAGHAIELGQKKPEKDDFDEQFERF